MSRTCGVTIEIKASKPDRIDMLSNLLDYGWSVNCNNQIQYLPLGDDDDYDWQFAPLDTWQNIYEIIKQKDKRNERLGLDLCWQNTSVGGSFLIDPLSTTAKISNIRLWTTWYAQRPKLENCDWITNQSWFIQRIIPPLLENGLFVASVESSDIY